MNSIELLAGIRAGRADQLAREFVLEGTPRIFESQPVEYETFKSDAARLLDIPANGVRVVGSARAGFSLSPDTFGVAFADASDIDIVVVDAAAFDSLWWTMSTWAFPFPVYGWAKELKTWCYYRINSCFNGWFEPANLTHHQRGIWVTPPPLREIRFKWFNAMKQLARHRLVAGHDCEVRLYRNWDCARRYHSWSLRQIASERT